MPSPLDLCKIGHFFINNIFICSKDTNIDWTIFVLSWVHYTKINLQQIHIFSTGFVSSMKPVLIRMP